MKTIAGELIINDRVASLFWARVAKSDGCWNWAGNRSPRGYGRLKVCGVARFAHRISYALHYGEPSRDMMVCHKCDNPSCVRPDHLFIGTAKDNTQDMISKGRKAIVCGEDTYNSKLTYDAVVRMRNEYAQGVLTVAEIAEDYGVTEEVARNAIKGITWKSVPGAVKAIPRSKGARKGVYTGENSYASKLTEKDVVEIRRLYRSGVRQKDIARMMGVGYQNVHLIVKNKTWKSVA